MSIKEEHLTFTTTTSSSSLPITFSDTLSDNNNNNNIIGSGGGGGGGGGSFHNSDNILYDGGNDVEFGFYRPDFRRNALVGSVQYYDRHVFLCYKNPRNWPPRIEAAEFDRLPRLLSAALASRKSDLSKETRLTICEGRDGTETSNGDVLIFPDMIRYRRLTHFDIDTFVEEVLIKDGEWLPGNPEKLQGSYIFVCCHGSRDRRCGVCGPPLVAKFKDEVEMHGLQGKVSISPCSHVGGHKYAGNVIIFGSNIKGEVSGHWYGYVTPNDVSTLLDQHILKGEIVESLWRGQMGLSEDEQQRAQELRLQISKRPNSGRNVAQNSSDVPEIRASTCGPSSDANGCHLSNGNGTCCQLSGSVEKDDTFESSAGETKAYTGKKGKKQLSRNNSQKGDGKRKVCSMPSWFESWERDDTYAAVAVVCAAVCVGVVYGCYKQL